MNNLCDLVDGMHISENRVKFRVIITNEIYRHFSKHRIRVLHQRIKWQRKRRNRNFVRIM